MKSGEGFDRSERAVIMRTGVVTSINGGRADVGELRNVPILHTTDVIVGATVLILLDRDSAIIVGAYAAP